MISALRLMGLLVGVSLIVAYVMLKRRRRIEQDAWWIALTIALIVVSLVPAVVSVPAGILSLSHLKAGRIITLLLLAEGVSLILLFGQRAKTDRLSRQLMKTIDHMTMTGFARRYPSASFGEILLIIPAYNEAENISSVIQAVPATVLGYSVSTLVVVDGGSDGTAAVAAQHGAFVCESPFNRGQGAASRVGYKLALRYGIPYVATMDADGQHHPHELENLLEPLVANKADVVQGSRRLGVYETDDSTRAVGVWFFSHFLTLLTGHQITDSSNGFRAMRSEVAATLPLYEDQYHTSELLATAARLGYRIVERPVTISPRQSGQAKKGRNLVYGFRFGRIMLRAWVRRLSPTDRA